MNKNKSLHRRSNTRFFLLTNYVGEKKYHYPHGPVEGDACVACVHSVVQAGRIYAKYEWFQFPGNGKSPKHGIYYRPNIAIRLIMNYQTQ